MVTQTFLNKGYRVIATVFEEKMIAEFISHTNPDVRVVNLSDTVNIFRSNASVGAITLSGRVTLSPLSSPDFLGFSDFDGDGKPDMAVANANSFIIQKSISKAKAALFIGRFAF